MTTVMIATVCFTIGAVLGSRYKVLILIPINVVAIGTIVATAIVDGFGFWQILSASILVLTALQVGYVAGAGVIVPFMKAREQNATRSAAPRPQRLR